MKGMKEGGGKGRIDMGGGMSCEKMEGGMQKQDGMSAAQQRMVECQAALDKARTEYWTAEQAARAEMDAAVEAEKAKHGS